MNAPYQIPKPKNWQDLETLCQAIWQEEWNPTYIKEYGRQGQSQDGVDILGQIINGSEIEFRAIQCKCKAEDKELTEETIKAEVNRAKKFNPPIRQYIIATTFDTDKKLDSFVAELSQQNIKDNYFSIALYGWQDIERLLELHLKVKDWYLNITKRQKPACEIMVNEPSDLTLHPVYIKKHYINKIVKNNQQYNTMDLLGANSINAVVQYYKNEKNVTQLKLVKGSIFHTRCKVCLQLKNTSDVTMKEVRVIVSSNSDSKFFLENEKTNEFNLNILKTINYMQVKEDSVMYDNMADYHPHDAHNLHEFYIEPPQDVDEILLYVRITAIDFEENKEIVFKIKQEFRSVDLENDKKVGEPDSIEPYIEDITEKIGE